MVGYENLKVLFTTVYCIVFILIHNVSVYAYDNIVTHPDLSEKSSVYSVFNKSDSLNNIGLVDGIYGIVGGLEVFRWIRKGAELEDAGSLIDIAFSNARFNNHFHNPLKEDWSEAGLSDVQHGISMILWAQDSQAQKDFKEGDWSWQKIRKRYLVALTAKTEAEREEAFGDTFRGLGHQVHLIQDAGQPDHVRNDAHPLCWRGVYDC